MFGVLCIVPDSYAGRGDRILGKVRPKRWLMLEHCRVSMAVYVVCTIRMPQNLLDREKDRRVGLALERLRKKGVRRVVVPAEYRLMAEAYTMTVTNGGQALESYIPQAITAWAAEANVLPSQLCLRFKGKRINRTVASGILAIASQVRAIHLDFEVGAPLLERRLLAEFGIAAGSAPPRDCLTITILLEEREINPGIILDLTGKNLAGTWQPSLLCRGVDIPPGVDGNAFVTALFLEAGSAFPGIEIAGKTVSQKRQGNDL